MILSFRHFIENEQPKPANTIDAMWQELGIDRNALPEIIESGPITIEDEGLTYNQALWQIIKPIEPNDMFVRIKFIKTLSPNFERAYQKGPDGKLVPYQGKVEGRIHIIPIRKLAQLFGRGLQVAQGGM